LHGLRQKMRPISRRRLSWETQGLRRAPLAKFDLTGKCASRPVFATCRMVESGLSRRFATRTVMSVTGGTAHMAPISRCVDTDPLRTWCTPTTAPHRGGRASSPALEANSRSCSHARSEEAMPTVEVWVVLGENGSCEVATDAC
jgi:hypothetical protein